MRYYVDLEEMDWRYLRKHVEKDKVVIQEFLSRMETGDEKKYYGDDDRTFLREILKGNFNVELWELGELCYTVPELEELDYRVVTNNGGVQFDRSRYYTRLPGDSRRWRALQEELESDWKIRKMLQK